MNRTEANQVEPANGTALDSVRRLEERLQDRRGAEEAAGARVAAAREEAERIVEKARLEAERDAEQHRRAALARADEEAGRVVAEAAAGAGRLRDLAAGDRPAAAAEVVAMILPGRGL